MANKSRKLPKIVSKRQFVGGSWVCRWNPATGKTDFIPKHLAAAAHTKGSGLQVIKDIEPFVNIATAKREVISGRRQRRDMMRAYGLTEVGNEKLSHNKTAFSESRRDVVNDLKQAYRQHGVDVL